MEAIRIELSHDQAWALAEFVKRLGWDAMRACAVDDDEADQIKAAIEQVRTGLAGCGYSPR